MDQRRSGRAPDKNCDGFLTKDDFLAGLAAAGVNVVPHEQQLLFFGEADVAQRGYISLRDFTKCFLRTVEPAGCRVPRASSSPALKTPRDGSSCEFTPDKRLSGRVPIVQSRQTGHSEQRRASPTRSSHSISSTPSRATWQPSNLSSSPCRVSSTPRSYPSPRVSPGGVSQKPAQMSASTTFGQFSPPIPRKLADADDDIDGTSLVPSAVVRKPSPVPPLAGLGVLKSRNRRTPRLMLPK